MRMNFRKKSMSFFLCMMLIVAMAFGTTGCNGKSTATNGSSAEAATEGVTAAEATEADAEVSTEAGEMDAEVPIPAAGETQILGEGSTVFPLSVVDAEGQETLFEIHTDKETVGEALVELNLIAGDMGDMGLYVKTVNGLTVDYDKDGKYWAFYINGKYAQSGVDSTNITEGDSYSLKVE